MKKRNIVLTFAVFIFLLLSVNHTAAAKGHLDQIHDYTITIDVNEDATLNINYHIEWEVLDSTSEGPLTWMRIGVPNDNNLIYEDSFTAPIDYISYSAENGGYYMDVYLDRAYNAGEVVTVDFTIKQDFMYEMDKNTEGETVYTFTPGWFNEIDVDHMLIKWNNEKALSWSPSCLVDEGYLTWEDALPAGRKMTISVTYPNDAYDFITYDYSDNYSSAVSIDNYTYYYNDSYSSSDDPVATVVIFIVVAIAVLGIKLVVSSTIGNLSYSSGSGLSSPTETKIVRKIVTYYPTCKGCGAVRPEGSDKCEYCGRSFIEKEETVEETKIEHPEKYKDEGVYRYGNNANTYIHVTHIPVLKHSSDYHHTYSGGSSSGSFHSSCVHSSSACACACACACAGGGRAGCSTKDFYNTNLKLSQLKKKQKA